MQVPAPDDNHVKSIQLINEEVIMTADITTSDTMVEHSDDARQTAQAAKPSFQTNQILPLSVSHDPIDQNTGPMGDITPEQHGCARNDICVTNQEFKIDENKIDENSFQVNCNEEDLDTSEPLLATREANLTKSTLAKAQQMEHATNVYKNDWSTCLTELHAAQEYAASEMQQNRAVLLLNCNELREDRWIDIRMRPLRHTQRSSLCQKHTSTPEIWQNVNNKKRIGQS